MAICEAVSFRTLYADKNNNDRILGTEENDVIIGGDAHDILSGGREQSGSDYIDGGLGNDYLVGDNSPGSNDTPSKNNTKVCTMFSSYSPTPSP